MSKSIPSESMKMTGLLLDYLIWIYDEYMMNMNMWWME